MIFFSNSSGSVNAANFALAKTFITKILEELSIGINATRVGIINFSNTVERIARLDTTYNKTELINMVKNMRYIASGTATHLALQEVRDNVFKEQFGMRPASASIPKVLILITDGVSDNPNETLKVATTIKQGGVTFFSVNVGKNLNVKDLEMLASDNETLFIVDDYSKMIDILGELRKTMCGQPTTVGFGNEVNFASEKDIYKYFKINLMNKTLDRGLTIKLKPVKGNAVIVHSFLLKNPKERYDLIDVAFNKREISETMQRESTDYTIYYNVKDTANQDTLYFGVKAKTDESQFTVSVVPYYENGVSRIDSNTFGCLFFLILAFIF